MQIVKATHEIISLRALYTVRKPGHTAWTTGIDSYADAVRECREADDQAGHGHCVYAELMIDDQDIKALRLEASIAGDRVQVVLCDRAIGGDVSAREECEVAIANALAQHD